MQRFIILHILMALGWAIHVGASASDRYSEEQIVQIKQRVDRTLGKVYGSEIPGYLSSRLTPGKISSAKAGLKTSQKNLGVELPSYATKANALYDEMAQIHKANSSDYGVSSYMSQLKTRIDSLQVEKMELARITYWNQLGHKGMHSDKSVRQKQKSIQAEEQKLEKMFLAAELYIEEQKPKVGSWIGGPSIFNYDEYAGRITQDELQARAHGNQKKANDAFKAEVMACAKDYCQYGIHARNNAVDIRTAIGVNSNACNKLAGTEYLIWHKAMPAKSHCRGTGLDFSRYTKSDRYEAAMKRAPYPDLISGEAASGGSSYGSGSSR